VVGDDDVPLERDGVADSHSLFDLDHKTIEGWPPPGLLVGEVLLIAHENTDFASVNEQVELDLRSPFHILAAFWALGPVRCALVEACSIHFDPTPQRHFICIIEPRWV